MLRAGHGRVNAPTLPLHRPAAREWGGAPSGACAGGPRVQRAHLAVDGVVLH